MITLIMMDKGGSTKINFSTTKFPDGTSQLWKLDDRYEQANSFIIEWDWEGDESEIFHLAMLKDLLPNRHTTLKMKYLPYARQDKYISNNATFALRTFAKLINAMKFSAIYSYDIHSEVARDVITSLWNMDPRNFHKKIETEYNPDVIFFPDHNAFTKYTHNFSALALYANKTRDQSTGKITSYEVVNERNVDLVDVKKVLIVDDLCDHGNTFIKAAEELKSLGIKKIALCVSHGLFSGGKEKMLEAGISEFFTTNSLIKNKDGYKV